MSSAYRYRKHGRGWQAIDRETGDVICTLEPRGHPMGGWHWVVLESRDANARLSWMVYRASGHSRDDAVRRYMEMQS